MRFAGQNHLLLCFNIFFRQPVVAEGSKSLVNHDQPTENPEFEKLLTQNNIEPLEACTLVMLSIGNY